mmetsp:Transcript_8962/g.17394  ORF Transcript_8962/g.17394 Transcript_8962/m.17394 type:complete len:252 (-) Transcript_8962:876-1631(-)
MKIYFKNKIKRQAYWKNFFWKEISDSGYLHQGKFLKETSDFNYYQNNGGTVLAVGAKNFSIIASDTRYSLGMALPSRNTTRVIKVCSNIVLATAGMFVDIFFLQNLFQIGIKKSKDENSEKCLLSSCAFYLSYILYSKRFFPYYSFNLLSGLETNRKGSVYSFDAIGSFEKTSISCVGNGQSQIQPILDGIFQKKSLSEKKDFQSLISVKNCIKDIFLKITERNISIGDGLQIFILTKKGIFIENHILKLD